MATKKTAPAKKTPPAKKTAPAKKPPAPKAPVIDAIPFDLRVLDGLEERTDNGVLRPPTYFAVSLRGRVKRRFLHVIQRDSDKGWPVMLLLADRDVPGAGPRLPGDAAWLRAIVPGTVHVLGADVPLLIEEIARSSGGHEPPPAQARPPYT